MSNKITRRDFMCTSTGMLQTGRYPMHTGIVMNWINTNLREYCIAEEGVLFTHAYCAAPSKRSAV